MAIAQDTVDNEHINKYELTDHYLHLWSNQGKYIRISTANVEYLKFESSKLVINEHTIVVRSIVLRAIQRSFNERSGVDQPKINIDQ